MSTLITDIDPFVCGPINQAHFNKLETLRQNQVALCNAIENINVGSATLFDTPPTVLNISRNRADGTYDSGVITLDLSTLAGVTIPANAGAAIVRCSSGVNGQDTSGGGTPSLFSYAHIEVATTAAQINGGNFFTSNQVPTLATYVDTNLQHCDNDMTNDVIVALDGGTSIAYSAKVRFDDTFGIDNGIARIRLIGFLV